MGVICSRLKEGIEEGDRGSHDDRRRHQHHGSEANRKGVDDGLIERAARSPRTEKSQQITRIWITPEGRQALESYRSTMQEILALDEPLSV